MMTIQNKLFKAITQNLQPQEVKDVKKHLNALLADFTGNPLSESKLDVFFSKFAGAENPNILAAELDINAQTVKKVAEFLSENLSIIFSDIGFNFHISEDEDISFLVPIIRFQTKDPESNYKRTFKAVIDVASARTEYEGKEKLTIVQSLALYDLDEDEYISMPERWDLSLNDVTYILEEYLEIGEVKSKSMTDEARYLLAMGASSFNDLQVLNDASCALATHISLVFKQLCGKVATMINLHPNGEFEINCDQTHVYELTL